jgi:hypothetical protein
MMAYECANPQLLILPSQFSIQRKEMNHAIKVWIVIGFFVYLFVSCGSNQIIPNSELRSIRRLAFEEATKQYVRSEASLQADYEARLKAQLESVRAGGKEQQFGRFNEQQAARLL